MRGRDDETRATARATWRGSCPTRTPGGRSRKPRSWPKRAGWSTRIRTSARTTADRRRRGLASRRHRHRRVEAGRRCTTSRRWCCRSRTASRTGRAGASPAFDLLAALETCADVFLRFGGHRQAAGVTLEAARIGELRRRLSAWANERLQPGGSGAAAAHRRAARPARDLERRDRGPGRLGPFGAANPKPVFRASPVDLMDAAAQAEGPAPVAAGQAGRPVVPRDRLARRSSSEAYLTANRYRPRAGVFARSERVPRRADDRTHRGRRARAGGGPRMRWQTWARRRRGTGRHRPGGRDLLLTRERPANVMRPGCRSRRRRT